MFLVRIEFGMPSMELKLWFLCKDVEGNTEFFSTADSAINVGGDRMEERTVFASFDRFLLLRKFFKGVSLSEVSENLKVYSFTRFRYGLRGMLGIELEEALETLLFMERTWIPLGDKESAARVRKLGKILVDAEKWRRPDEVFSIVEKQELEALIERYVGQLILRCRFFERNDDAGAG